MDLTKLVAIGTVNHVNLFEVDSHDVSGGATWEVSSARAASKVLRPTGQDASYTIVIPDDGLFFVDTTAGSDASGNDATVKCEGGSGVTVNDGHGAVVVAVGGTATKLDVSG